jgi:hypothetical protein
MRVAPPDGRARCTYPIHWSRGHAVRPDPDVKSPFGMSSTPTLAYIDILLEFVQLLQFIDTSEPGDRLVPQTAHLLTLWMGAFFGSAAPTATTVYGILPTCRPNQHRV